MRDTSPEVEQNFRDLLLQRSGEERLKMECSRHATAVALVKASVLANAPAVSPATVRQALVLRFYGRDFDTRTREKILLALGRISDLPPLTSREKEGQPENARL